MEKEIKMIDEVLYEFNLHYHLKGTHQIKEALIYIINNNISVYDIYGNLFSKVFPEVAKITNSTIPRVERNMRHAISYSWSKTDSEVFVACFGKLNKQPTITHLLATFTNKIINKQYE